MSSLVERYRAFAVDLDGVVWRGEELIEGAAEGIGAIRRAGKPVLFLTNNATYKPIEVARRLASDGIEASETEVLNPAVVGKKWLAARGLEGKRAFVLGDPPVAEQFSEVVEVVEVTAGVRVEVVIVARDSSFSFRRLEAAARAVREGAALVAVNRDPIMPVKGGLEPGTGAILAAIEAASGTTAVVLGKPNLPMMQAATEILGTEAVLMIGDQPSSDVAGARLVGWDAAVVMTGISVPGEALVPAPDYILQTLREVARPPKG